MGWAPWTMRYPPRTTYQLTGGGTNKRLYSLTSRWGVIFRSDRAGTIDSLDFNVSSITTAQDIKVGFQGLSGGEPDNTFTHWRVYPLASIATGDNVVGLVTDDGTDTGAKRTVAKGEDIVVVIQYDSTLGDLNLMANYMFGSGGPGFIHKNQMSFQWVSSWTSSSNQHPLRMRIKFSDGTYLVHPWHPYFTSGADVLINSGTSPDEVGTKFQLPFTCKVDGIHAFGASRAKNIVLYDSADTVLGTVDATTELDAVHSTSGTGFYKFASTVTLSKDTTYRMTWQCNEGSNAAHGKLTLPDQAAIETHVGHQNWHWTERTDLGAWTDTVTAYGWQMTLNIVALQDGL